VPLLLLPIAPEAGAFGWDDLWQNQNQRGSVQFEKGDHEQAAELFKHPGWKASSLYRAESYDEAVQYWSEQDSESAHYNRGNALAKLGRFEDAIEAYEKALDMNPQHQDASYNKRLLEDAMQQQQQQQQEEQGQQDQQQSNQQQQSDDSGEEQQSSAAAESQQNSQSRQDHSAQQADPRPQQQTQAETSTSDAIQPAEQKSKVDELAEMEAAMSEQAADQWLRKIPDDPGGLLRRKFIYQYANRDDHSVEINPW
jgi:Ca-activated chloride channel family protein